MPLQKLEFRPGVNRESTTLANEGGWFESDKVRWRSGYPEKIGGWVKDTGQIFIRAPISTFYADGFTTPLRQATYNFIGTCRSLFNWLNLSGYNLMGVGTSDKFYIQNGTDGYTYDITPIRKTSTTVANSFSTDQATNTGFETTLVVTDANHGAQSGDYVIISNTSGFVNGVTDTNINGEHVITYLTDNTYAITVAGTANATGAPTPSVTATFNYQLTTGANTFTPGVGWGSSGFGGALTTNGATTLTSAMLNVANTTTLAAISATDTTISVGSTNASVSSPAFSSSGVILIGDEQIQYSGITSTSFTGCVRGFNSTTAASYPVGTGVVELTSENIQVVSTANFTGSGSIRIGYEVITYASKTATTFQGCVRGYTSSPAAHSIGDAVVQNTVSTGWGAPAPSGISFGTQLRLWSQGNFGQDLIINPRGSSMYYWAVNTNPNIYDRAQKLTAGGTITVRGSTVNIDASCPSLVNSIAISDGSRFVIAFGANDPSGVLAPTYLDPLLIRWSDQEDYATWTPSATNQAGDFRLSQGSEIVANIQTRQEILVWTDAAVYSMQYLGPPYIWGVQIMGSNTSIAGPNVVATANNVTYWMGMDKFYMYTGRVETLPCTLRQYVFDDINLNQSYQFFASTNEGYNEIWWFYCSTNSNTIDRYVVFNHLERTWYYGTMERTAWLDTPLRKYPVAAGYNGFLLYHENGNDDGSTNPPTPIVAYCQSSDFDIGDGHNFGMVWRIIPDVTFDGSNVNNPSVIFTVRPRQNPGANYGSTDQPNVASTQNYQLQQTYNVQQFTEYAYVRIRGRQMAFKISSDGLGVAWQLGSPRLDVRADGRR